MPDKRIAYQQKEKRSWRKFVGTLLTLTALCLSSVAWADTPANREWYLLNFGIGACSLAKTTLPLTPTPDAYHRAVRQEGVVDQVHVEKTPDGTVLFVGIMTRPAGTPVTLLWFPSLALCDLALKHAQDTGAIPNNDDLK